MGYWMAFLMAEKKKKQGDMSATLGDVNKQYDMNSLIYDIQFIMNAVHDITEQKGWDVTSWTMEDVIKFASACGRQKHERTE